MCGIVGYYGSENAAPILLNGLEKLEYRGYDSAGIAVVDGGKLQLVRKKGRVSELFSARGIQGHLGIGHTRWATHGAPSEINAHPHVYGKFAVVHNGIIENEYSLKEECRARGDVFSSETDSEVIAHLLDFYYEGNLVTAVKDTVGILKGSYALAVVCEECDCIVCVRKARERGVRVSALLPGGTATDFTYSRRIYGEDESLNYAQSVKKASAALANIEQGGMNPSLVAEAIIKLAEKKNPPPVAVAGGMNGLTRYLYKLLPERITDWYVRKKFNQK